MARAVPHTFGEGALHHSKAVIDHSFAVMQVGAREGLTFFFYYYRLKKYEFKQFSVTNRFSTFVFFDAIVLVTSSFFWSRKI